MTNENNYKNNPLNGVSLKNMLTELVSHYGFDILFAYLNINCFKTNPSIESSLKFLKKTEWAREKVEVFYLYKYKSLPSVSSEQFDVPPRDRIVPDDQTPNEPAVLSFKDAEEIREKNARKSAERAQSTRHRTRSDKKFGAQRNSKYTSDSSSSSVKDDSDPWAKWRK